MCKSCADGQRPAQQRSTLGKKVYLRGGQKSQLTAVFQKIMRRALLATAMLSQVMQSCPTDVSRCIGRIWTSQSERWHMA